MSPVTLIRSSWSSGSLVFHESTSIAPSVSYDVLTIGTGAVKIGNTSNDVDFQWYGTGSKSFVLNLGDATAISSGLAWTITGDLAVTGAITLTGDVSLTGDLTLATEDVSVTQGHLIYLDGQNGGEYLWSDTANEATLRATTAINLAIGSNDEVAVSSTAVTLATNELVLSAANASVALGYAIYFDGQDGGEFIWSDVANYLTLNATTGVNLAINGTDEIAITSSAVTLASNDITLTAGDASVSQGAFIYLDGQQGGEYLISDTENEATLHATTTLNLAIGSNDEVSVSSSAVTLASNDLTLTAGDASVALGSYIYLDGQGGGEYLVSDATDEATLNATTTLNLAIGGTDEVAVSATAVTLASNDLTISAGDISVTQGAYIYLDGQQGGEYVVSDVANYLTANATTGINLAVNQVDEVAITSTAVTLASNNLTLTAGDLTVSAGDISVAQASYIYLDGDQGGEYIVSNVADYLTAKATTGINLAIGSNDEVAIDSSAVTLATNDLTLTAGDLSVSQGAYIYLDGQGGGEYIVSDVANYLTLNGTTGINLAIGTADEASLTSAAFAPATSDGLTLGTSSAMWSDLYIASGGVINFNNNDVSLTHSSDTLTLAGGNLAITAGQFVTGAPTKVTITDKASSAILTTSEAGVITAADNIYLYLPTLTSNSGVTFMVKADEAFSGGVAVYPASGSGHTLDGVASLTSTARYDALILIAGSGTEWHVFSKIGTWN